MKTLFFGAGPLGSLYAHLLHRSGNDVSILARNERLDFIEEHGLVLVNEFTGRREVSKVRVVNELTDDDAYDLIVILIRKNKLAPVFQALKRHTSIRNVLFMGNNVSGFDEYLKSLPRDKVLFGFPGAGGGIKNGIVHYVDSEKPNGNRMPVTIGEIDGGMRERTKHIKALFESSDVPVDLMDDVDGWLKYHAAFILPICGALFMHDVDNNRLAEDEDGIRMFIRACKECGNVLRKAGFTKRQPFKFNLFYWTPEWMLIKMFQQLLGSRYAEIAFTMHAKAAADEMRELADEFKMLIDKASVPTPNFDRLTGYIK